MWPELSAKLAMRFGRAPILEDVDAESFARFAEDAGLALPFLRRRAAAMAAGIHGAIVDGIEVPGLADMSYLGGLPAIVLDRAERLALKSKLRSEEHTSELQSLMRISYAVFCLKKKNNIY